MSDFLSPKSTFLQKIISVIEEHLDNEAFGVSELADLVHMSRSNLLRKVKQETGESVSVYIRNVRLHHAKKLLKDETLTVSEISFAVGFSSSSYFTKCYRELFGYTPGEEVNQTKIEVKEPKEITEIEIPVTKPSRKNGLILSILTIVAVTSIALFWFLKPKQVQDIPSKSIAVLPFKNDSIDSSNVYFMNGLMESILDNFQKIEDIKLTSRTTVEKYRGMSKTIPELSKELNVTYIVEGSGQKVGNEILLTIQLIEAQTDKHMWSKQYRREMKDVFQIQMEIAQGIANEINAIITPEEKKRIEKIPTNNLVAYDYYLQGLAYLKNETGEGLNDAIIQFKKAINEDGNFTNAYAYIAIAYYYLDMFLADKQYTEELKMYADKSMLLDPDLGESLIAHALYFMQIDDFNQAVTALEKVLEYYPNVGWVHNLLSNIYTTQLPNSEKYLKHALHVIQSIVYEQDSVTASYSYLHLSNALAQSGFIDESIPYIQKSLVYNPNNLFSQYLLIYLHLAQNFNLVKAKNELAKVLKKDTTRLDIIQEIAKVSYTMGDYEEAWKYYDKLISGKKKYNLDIYQSEDIKIGFVLTQLGRPEEAKAYYESYFDYAKKDESLYKDLILSAYYACIGKAEIGMQHLKAFAEKDNYQYWFVLFLEKDPIIRVMENEPDYKKTLKRIEQNFWNKHNQTRKMLEKEKVFIN